MCVLGTHDATPVRKHNFGVVDGSPNSDQDPMHERNSGTFLVMYVGNGIDGLGKKENSILLSYHVLFPTSDCCVPSECILYLHIWVMKQREHETAPLIRPFLKLKHWPVLIMYLDIVPVWFILKQREHDAIVMVLYATVDGLGSLQNMLLPYSTSMSFSVSKILAFSQLPISSRNEGL